MIPLPRIPTAIFLWVGAALGLALCLTGLWGMGQKSAKERAEAAVIVLRAQVTQAQVDANARVAAVEEAWRIQRKAADMEAQRAREDNDRRLRAALRDADGLRAQLRAAMDAPIPPGSDPAATYRDRAAACGELLADALRAHAQRTGEAEAHAGDVRALLDAWPTNQESAVKP